MDWTQSIMDYALFYIFPTELFPELHQYRLFPLLIHVNNYENSRSELLANPEEKDFQRRKEHEWASLSVAERASKQ